VAQQQVGFGLDQRGLVAAVPEGAGPPIDVVDVLHVPAADRDRHLPHALGLFRRQQQMDMVGHQHAGVQPAALAHQCLVQPTEVGTPVVVVEEARRAVVAALHDVQR
jgi:hypothetical protein